MYTIFIVNDSPLIIELFCMYLEKRGYRAIGIDSSEKCLKLLKKETPDLILSNINREPIDGWEFKKNVKGNPITKNIPVVITSAQDYTSWDRQQYGHLIEEYVYLPVGKQGLYGVIERVINKGK